MISSGQGRTYIEAGAFIQGGIRTWYIHAVDTLKERAIPRVPVEQTTEVHTVV